MTVSFRRRVALLATSCKTVVPQITPYTWLVSHESTNCGPGIAGYSTWPG
jgi:hypothetical protein